VEYDQYAPQSKALIRQRADNALHTHREEEMRHKNKRRGGGGKDQDVNGELGHSLESLRLRRLQVSSTCGVVTDVVQGKKREKGERKKKIEKGGKRNEIGRKVVRCLTHNLLVGLVSGGPNSLEERSI